MDVQTALSKIAAFCTDLDVNGLAAYDKYPVNEMETAYTVVANAAGVSIDWLSEISVGYEDTVESLKAAYLAS